MWSAQIVDLVTYMHAETTPHMHTYEYYIELETLGFCENQQSQSTFFSLLTTLQLPITTVLLESSTFSVSENPFVAIFLLLGGYISFCHQSLETSVILYMTVAAKLFYCVNCLLFSFRRSSFLLLIPWTIKKDTNKNSTAVRSLYCYEIPIMLLSAAEHCHKTEASEQTPLSSLTLTSSCASTPLTQSTSMMQYLFWKIETC